MNQELLGSLPTKKTGVTSLYIPSFLKTCFKNPNNPSCIDLLITNRPKRFQNSMAIETGLSDFHKMCITVMKMYYSKQKPTIIHYRKFKDFNNDSFIKDLQTLLTKSFNEEAIPFQALRESVNVTLEKHAPTKKRYARANQAPYMNKKLSKEIMKRSRLRNNFFNAKSDLDRKAYNKQRNYVVSLLRKEKSNFTVILALTFRQKIELLENC